MKIDFKNHQRSHFKIFCECKIVPFLKGLKKDEFLLLKPAEDEAHAFEFTQFMNNEHF